MSSLRERILGRLDEMGASPKRALGQNFLVSEGAIERILRAAKGAGGPPPAAIIEVGPGLGSLTDAILEWGISVVLIELDRAFAEYWRSRQPSAPEPGASSAIAAKPYSVIEADALALDWSSLQLPEGSLLLSNLPYQISSSLVIERSLAPCGISRMVLMFQKEVAQRLVARAKTPEYGLLTVIAQAFWDVRSLFEAGPRDFYPPPSVASRVVEFRRSEPIDRRGRPCPGIDRAAFLRFVKSAFSHRRKLMARNLASGFFAGDPGGAGRVAQGLAELGLSAAQARAEELDPAAFVSLFQATQARP
jgi:16S rRNA (adenine1518-N6/adenine1519-N6)-dimethyltransferase